MRDPKRIKEILSIFEEVWEQNPDLRLCQLVVNITRMNDPFYIEDDIFLEYLKDIKNVLDREGKNG